MIVYCTFIDTNNVQHMNVPIVFEAVMGKIELRRDGTYRLWWARPAHGRFKQDPKAWPEADLGYMRSLLGG